MSKKCYAWIVLLSAKSSEKVIGLLVSNGFGVECLSIKIESLCIECEGPVGSGMLGLNLTITESNDSKSSTEKQVCNKIAEILRKNKISFLGIVVTDVVTCSWHGGEIQDAPAKQNAGPYRTPQDLN